ncbi:MAG: AMP-binding protein, partial [bacterium]|nr:AMP-binding protein [bacterium]
ARVRDVALGAYAHQDVPFEKLVEELEPKRNLGQNPLFQVLFALYYAPAAIRELGPGLRVEFDGVAIEQAKFDLTISLTVEKEGLTNSLEYNTDLFDVTTIRRLAGHLETLLAGAVADPERRLSELVLMGVAERGQLLVEWNDTRIEYERATPVHELIETRVAASPDAIAVVDGGAWVSYAELNRRANRLAHSLRARGAEPEVPVGIFMERSVELVVALLGALKSGAAFVPLDPSYPDERLQFMATDTEISLAVTEDRLSDRLTGN